MSGVNEMQMNKLMGFYELKNSRLPAVQWKEFTLDTKLAPDKLWTIRTAVFSGRDINLPRHIGIAGAEAEEKARELYRRFNGSGSGNGNGNGLGIVVYYPFFVAEKSGTLNVFSDKLVIEAVDKDLWNLVTDSKRDVTVFQNAAGDLEYSGNGEFLSQEELTELLSQVPEVRKLFKSPLIEGKSVLLEWSFAFECDRNQKPVGEKYLVFYEARTV